MKKQILTRLPAACMMFTALLLSSAVQNILTGYAASGWNVILVFLWMVFFQVVDYLLSLIPFRSCRQYRLCYTAADYLLVMAFWLWGGWIRLTFWSIVTATINYLIAAWIILRIVQAWRRAKADEINRELACRRAAAPQNPPAP